MTHAFAAGNANVTSLHGQIPDGVLLTLDRQPPDDAVVESHTASSFGSTQGAPSSAKKRAKKAVLRMAFYAFFRPVSNHRMLEL